MSMQDDERVQRLREHWGVPPEMEPKAMVKQLLAGQDAGVLATIYKDQRQREKDSNHKQDPLPRAPSFDVLSEYMK